MKIIVDTYLRIPAADYYSLTESQQHLIHEALTVINPDDPDNPEYLGGWDRVSNHYIIPRGFAEKLRKGFTALGVPVEWEDRRAIPGRGGNMPFIFKLRDYQVDPATKMLKVEQGICCAPPAAGKTIMASHFIANNGTNTLILVDRINLATQWQERILESTGYKCGIIGDLGWEEKTVTVALRQTLWSKKDELDASGWWGTWGALVVDECHSISAETVQELVQRFPAYYRIGLSATPDRDSWLARTSRAIFGEIFATVTDQELEDAGVLVRPKVIAVKTPFEFDWNPRGDVRTQWHRLAEKLATDPGRNRLFAEIIGKMRGYSCMVQTDRTGHIDELAAYALAAGWPQERVFLMTGRQNNAMRTAAKEFAEQGDCLIFSTIAKEALDIPRLDRYFVMWPTKKEYAIIQMVGRVKRVHEQKSPPIVYDFYDWQVTLLRKHFAMRRGVYDRESLPLIIV